MTRTTCIVQIADGIGVYYVNAETTTIIFKRLRGRSKTVSVWSCYDILIERRYRLRIIQYEARGLTWSFRRVTTSWDSSFTWFLEERLQYLSACEQGKSQALHLASWNGQELVPAGYATEIFTN